MTQFLWFTIFLIVVAGLAIHADVEFPWFLSWFGQLPGDILLKKGKMTIFVPLTSSLLVAALLSFFLSLFSRK